MCRKHILQHINKFVIICKESDICTVNNNLSYLMKLIPN